MKNFIGLYTVIFNGFYIKKVYFIKDLIHYQFVQKGMKVLADFKESMKKNFFAPFKVVDFSDTQVQK